MTQETKDKIISDAIQRGYLIEVCAGCSRPSSHEGAKHDGVEFYDCACPAGTSIRWSNRIVEVMKRKS